MTNYIKQFSLSTDTMTQTFSPRFSVPQFNQGDVNTDKLSLTVTHQNTVMDLTGASVSVGFQKPDGTIVYQDTTSGVTVTSATTGQIDILLNTQTRAAPGLVVGAVRVTYPGNLIIETEKFSFNVETSLASDQAIASANDISPLIGTATLTTNAKDIKGAINEVNASVAANTNTLNKNVLPNKLDYKTVSITTGFGTTGTSKPTIDYWQHIHTQGAHATLCVMVGITSATDSNPIMIADSVFTSTLADASTSGVPIDMIKLHLGTQYSDGFNRGSYLPSDVNAYFTNWQTICLHYAGLCVQNNVPILCIGCEQPNQTASTYLSNWQTIINVIKVQYPTLLLTYAPKTWEFTTVDNQGLYAYLDIIGVNVYLNYTQTPLSVATPKLDDLCKAFYGDRSQQNVLGTIDQLATTYGKPFFITEIGCMPTDKGLTIVSPYDYGTQPVNYDAVYWLMNAAFTCLFKNRNVKGFAWWHAASPFKYWDPNVVTNAEQIMIDYVKGGLL